MVGACNQKTAYTSYTTTEPPVETIIKEEKIEVPDDREHFQVWFVRSTMTRQHIAWFMWNLWENILSNLIQN